MPWVYKALAIAALVSRLMIIAENGYRIYERKKYKKRYGGRYPDDTDT